MFCVIHTLKNCNKNHTRLDTFLFRMRSESDSTLQMISHYSIMILAVKQLIPIVTNYWSWIRSLEFLQPPIHFHYWPRARPLLCLPLTFSFGGLPGFPFFFCKFLVIRLSCITNALIIRFCLVVICAFKMSNLDSQNIPAISIREVILMGFRCNFAFLYFQTFFPTAQCIGEFSARKKNNLHLITHSFNFPLITLTPLNMIIIVCCWPLQAPRTLWQNLWKSSVIHIQFP